MLPVSHLEHVLGWVVLIAGFVMAIVLFIYVGADVQLPVTLVMTALMLLLIGMAWLLYRMLRYRRVLEMLREGILCAQEGTLDRLEVTHLPDDHLRRLISDYNLLITYLQRIFAAVEGCQNRVLDERNKINAMLQSLPCALLSVDNDLQVSMVNTQAESIFRVPEKKLIGSSLFDLFELSEVDRALLRDAFLYKRRICNQEIETRLGHSLVHITLNLSFIIENDANMDAVITLQDVSDYKRLQENVYNQEKLVAMGELAAGVAHELNTPLGSIFGYAQLMSDAMGEDQKQQKKWIQIICNETRRCSRIIDDLLHYARREGCTEGTCDINSLINDVIKTYANCRIKHYNINIELDLISKPLPVEGSCGQLDIVLVNLLSNSIQALAGRPASLIKLTTRLVEPDVITLIIEDNGEGVPREVRGRIFEPFFTTKEVGSGSGLGLAISHAVLKHRGASIRYDDDYSGGARFIMEFPYVHLEETKAAS